VAHLVLARSGDGKGRALETSFRVGTDVSVPGYRVLRPLMA
jgi:hypothetical protein